jgi:hypothetical protein
MKHDNARSKKEVVEVNDTKTKSKLLAGEMVPQRR